MSKLALVLALVTVAGCKPMLVAGGAMMASGGASLIMQGEDASALDRDVAVGTTLVGAALIATAFLLGKDDCSGHDCTKRFDAALGWN
ncbi:MAG TPA: hypothetical protein VGM39_03640 [Kofleriaceae bacterium]|jgi:hypothetical protein